MDERSFWVAWSRAPKLGGRRMLALASHFGSLAAAWEAPAARLAQVESIGAAIAAELAAYRQSCRPQDVLGGVEHPRWRVLTWVDDDYPAPLRDLSDPPPALYVMGELPDWERAIAMVGARAPSAYGQRMARRLAGELAGLGAVIVSGVAAGIDRAAHEGALAVGPGRTVGVLGNGFHYVYPAANRDLYRAIAEGGALLTEYPPDVQAHKAHFPYRNRLIAGLSRGVIVVEARRKSGSLITVDHALEQGRQVFAVPGPIDSELSEGPHDLLKQGARLLASTQDVLDELGWAVTTAPASATPKGDDPTEQRIYELLAPGKRHIDALAAEAGLPPGQLGSVLVMMELKGYVQTLPGQHYQRA
ncbi:MAG TPA: DNA-processing protein DprA [Oscillatoriaceae cyanobacterium]